MLDRFPFFGGLPDYTRESRAALGDPSVIQRRVDFTDIDEACDYLRDHGYRVGFVPFRYGRRELDLLNQAITDTLQRHGHSMGAPPGRIFNNEFSRADDYVDGAEFPSVLEMAAEERVGWDAKWEKEPI